jgi:hypothetical protein
VGLSPLRQIRSEGSRAQPEAQDALFIQQYWFPLAAEPVPPLRYYCNYHYPLWPSQRTPKVIAVAAGDRPPRNSSDPLNRPVTRARNREYL